MDISSFGKILFKYGVPVFLGVLLATALIYTSLQPNTTGPQPASAPRTTRAASTKIARVEASPTAIPTRKKGTQTPGTPNTPTITSAPGTPGTPSTPNRPSTPAAPGEPTQTRTPRPSVTLPAGQTPQSSPTPTGGNTPLPSEIKVTITTGPALREAHARHTATRLLDGKILVVGGSRATDEYLSSVDVYDPATGAINPRASLSTERHGHVATLLKDGRVLVTGGYNSLDNWLYDAEIYDPASNSWMEELPNNTHGTDHTATLLKDGRVLIVGGCLASDQCTESAEIFDPENDTWQDASSLDHDLYGHTAQLLDDGRVLIAGGAGADGSNPGSGGLVYDPGSDTWTATGPMVHQRKFAESVPLSNGRVLVVGGVSLEASPKTLPNAEIYDPATNKWAAAADLQIARYAFRLVKLSGGQVLAIGGSRDYENNWTDSSFISEIESYDPAANRWHAAGTLTRPAAFAASALLADGRVLLAGGRTKTTYYLDTWLITVLP
jgi:N-acetylneuraminic acid mutarotase